jgi:hypothetical protein
MLGDLGVSTLRSIKNMTQFSSLFEHQTSHAACFNARRLLYECVFNALLFSSSYRPDWETCFSSRCYSTYVFFFFGSSYQPSCPPQCSDTTL